MKSWCLITLLAISSAVLVWVVTTPLQAIPAAHAASLTSSPSGAIPPCDCPHVRHKRVWSHNLSRNAKGHLVRRVWRWIPAHHTKHAHFHPGHWTCGRHPHWHPGHWTYPRGISGHWGWVYTRVG